MKTALKFAALSGALLMLVCISAPAIAADSTADLFEASFGHEREGNYKTALNKVLKVLQAEPDNYVAYLRAGWLTYMSGKSDQAVGYYKKAIALKPNSIEAKLGLTLPYIALKNWEAAETSVQDVIKTDPANYYANSRLAWILYSQGRYSEALAAYGKVHEWYPGDLEMLLGLGWTYLKMGNKNKARVYFKQVLSIRQNNVRALQGINAL